METSSMLLFILIACCCTVQTLADPVVQEAEASRVIFGDETFISTSQSAVGHMEPDLFNEPGSILFSFGSSIKTTDGPHVKDVVGSIDSSGYVEGDASTARFDYITNFLQIAKDKVVIVDRNNQCLRLFDRTSGITSPYVGDCTERGNRDGVGQRANFYNPSDILLDERDNKTLLVVEGGGNSIRGIETATKRVWTIIKDEKLLQRPRFALFDNDDKNILYMTMTFRVVKFTFSDKKVTLIAGVRRKGGPFPDGTLSSGVFGFFTAELVQLNPKTLLVGDVYQNEVRVLDMANDQLTSICQPRVNNSLIHPVGCDLKVVTSLLLHNDSLFVGDRNGIHVFPVDLIPINGVDRFAAEKCQQRTIKAAPMPGDTLAKVEIEKGVTLLLEKGDHQYVTTEKGFDCVIRIIVEEASSPIG